jgi:hypothetical protein
MKSIATFACLLAWTATARADYAQHKVTSVTRVKDKSGKIVGAKINVLFMPGATWGGFSPEHVMVGVGKANLQANPSGNYSREATDPKAGYLHHLFPREAGMAQPEERSYTLKYGEGNQLKSGDTVDVITSWMGKDIGKGSVHVWGIKRTSPNGIVIKLP